MMKTKILVAAIASFLVVGSASADQFLTKANERNNIVSPGGPDIDTGGASCATATPIAATPFNDTGTTVGATNTNTSIPAGCSDYTTTAGPDLIYTFTTTPSASGINITATGAGAYDISIYVLSTCGNSATCVVGADATLDGGTETISGTTFPAGTYGLYIDSFYATGGASAGSYTLAFTGTLPVEVTEFSVD